MDPINQIDAAWNLAGESDNAGTVRSRVKAYAKRHSLPLPGVAHKATGERDADEITQKAEFAELFHDGLHVNSVDHTVVADCVLYDETLLEKEEKELATVHKAFNPISKDFLVEKAITNDDGTVTIEGWISTPHKDLEKDIVEPECFLGATFKGYFERGAPISSNHELTPYPVGHLQRAVLVRDGAILQEEQHPVDPQAFIEGPGQGTGWYGRGVVDGSDASKAIKKGNVRSFSWIGNLAEYTPTTGGGRRYKRVDPLIETTVAAYPVNKNAVMRIAKAYGLDEKEL
jgi:hypothetical protein